MSTLIVNDEYTLVAGVIRNSGNGWALLNDDGHEPIGITGVSQDDQKIIITYAPQSKVIALTVTVDETMAAEGYSVGASVGLDTTRIYIYDKDNNAVNPKDYVNKLGNIWIEGYFKMKILP